MFRPEDKQHFVEAGYLIVREVVPRAMLDELGDTVAGAFRKFVPHAGPFADRPLEDPRFHAALRAFRNERPADFGLMFDTVQTSVALWRFGTDAHTAALAAKLMDDTVSGLSVTDLLLRMDAPQDTRNTLAWHQDSSYFRQNARGAHGCVCSVALKRVAPDEGPLEILPGSHAGGRIAVRKSGGTTAIASEQYRIPDALTRDAIPLSLPLDAGDAVFLNFDLIHRSGSNVSPSFRFTAISRFHRMFASDFVPGRLVYTASKVLRDPATTRAAATPERPGAGAPGDRPATTL